MRRSRPSHRAFPTSQSPLLLLPSILLSFSAMTFAPRSAYARCNDPQTSACINSDTLWPHAGPSHFVGIGGTDTVAAGRVGFGLFTTYLSRPILLHIPSPALGGTDLKAVDNQVDTTFLFSYGISKRLQLDLEMPLTLIQSGSGVSGITGGDGLRDTAMRDLRFGFAFAIVPPDAPDEPGTPDGASTPSPWSLAGRLVVSAPTGDAGQFAGDKSAVFSPSLAGEVRLGRFFSGMELGVRVRETSELEGARIGTQGYAAIGFGFDILTHDGLSLTAEGRALPVFTEQHDLVQNGAFLESQPNGKHIVPAEWTAALRSAPFRAADVAFQLGGGGAIPFGDPLALTTPRFRFTLGIVYAPRPPTPPKALSPTASASP